MPRTAVTAQGNAGRLLASVHKRSCLILRENRYTSVSKIHEDFFRIVGMFSQL